MSQILWSQMDSLLFFSFLSFSSILFSQSSLFFARLSIHIFTAFGSTCCLHCFRSFVLSPGCSRKRGCCRHGQGSWSHHEGHWRWCRETRRRNLLVSINRDERPKSSISRGNFAADVFLTITMDFVAHSFNKFSLSLGLELIFVWHGTAVELSRRKITVVDRTEDASDSLQRPLTETMRYVCYVFTVTGVDLSQFRRVLPM